MGSLRGKILVRALLIALVPLVVVGSIALGSLFGLSQTVDSTLASERDQLSNDVAGRRLTTDALLVAQELDGFLHERISDVTGWASDPTITRAAARATGRSQQYAATGDDELETAFADRPVLGTRRSVEAFLDERLRREQGFSSLTFTDRNGFNVTSTSRPDDFVQRDEDWWQVAQIRGLHFGAIDYSAAEDAHSLPISARVKNPSNGEGFGGVLQARLNMRLLQQVADRNATVEGREITILTPDGQILAETATDHRRERIMQPRVMFATERLAAVREVLGASAPGFLVEDGEETVVGHASLQDVRDRPGGTAEDVNAFFGIDPGPINWVVMVEEPADLAFAQLDGLTQVRTDLSDTATRLASIGLLALLLAIIGATIVSGRLSQRIVQPLLSLRRSAYEVAERQLPQLVEHVQSGDPDARPPAVPAVEVRTDDEVEDVADAFNVVRDTAVELAAEQARSRRNVATMFVNLGRRNQGLLSRQLEFIDTLERRESDPDLLDGLFRLDHLATRMRRNAESLLVLAGEPPPRRWGKPVPLDDVVRGAIAEVEDYQRVDVDGVSDVTVDGQAASDVAHLLAELIENATNFSPPDVPVTVAGRWLSDGYALSVVDDGIGMSATELSDANERLISSPSLDRVPSSYLGLFVVGRLAARHGIEVRLLESMSEGIVAKVVLPSTLIHSSTRPPTQLVESSVDTADPRAPQAPEDEVTVSRRRAHGTLTDVSLVEADAGADAVGGGSTTMEPRPDERHEPEPAVPEPIFATRHVEEPVARDHTADDTDPPADGGPATLRRRTPKRQADDVAAEADDATVAEPWDTEQDTSPIAPLRLDQRRDRRDQIHEVPSDDSDGEEPAEDPHHAHQAARRASERLGRFQRAVRRGRSEVSANPRGTTSDTES